MGVRGGARSENWRGVTSGRTLLRFPSKLAYSSRTSCSSGDSDSASSELAPCEVCETEKGWSGASVAMAVWLLPWENG